MGRLLLVGNSRWHWAERAAGGLRVWHENGPPAAAVPWGDLEAWACVGTLPQDALLPEQRRIGLQQLPLQHMPPWLGIDRALTGWQAWRQQSGGVLVADAGTCLSLTCIDEQGCFRGGRLSAGLALQLRSLAEGTAQLPAVQPGAEAMERMDSWPVETAAAMAQGCLRACAAAVLQGWRDLGGDGHGQLWLTGGDAVQLEPLLRREGLQPVLAPNLALEALAALAGDQPLS